MDTSAALHPARSRDLARPPGVVSRDVGPSLQLARAHGGADRPDGVDEPEEGAIDLLQFIKDASSDGSGTGTPDAIES
jgi:hypothetical protein